MSHATGSQLTTTYPNKQMNDTVQNLTFRWDVIQEARLKEMQYLMEQTLPQQRPALAELLNRDRFFEDIFDSLEEQLRKFDPDHSYLPENQITL